MPELEEILPGLHRWVAHVSDWTPDQGGAEGWGQEVGCVAYESEGALVVVDPLVESEDWASLDALVSRHGGPVAVVTTCPWHARSSGKTKRRYVNSHGAETYAHAHAVADRKRLDFEVDHVIEHGPAELPGGVEAIPTDIGNGEITLWIQAIRTIVAADVLIGAEGERTETLRVCPAAWLEPNSDVASVKAALEPFLERDVRAVVPLHGEPILAGASEALKSALTS